MKRIILAVGIAAVISLIGCSKDKDLDALVPAYKPPVEVKKPDPVLKDRHVVAFKNAIGDEYSATFRVYRNENHPNGVVVVEKFSVKLRGLSKPNENIVDAASDITRYLAFVNQDNPFVSGETTETFRTVEAVIIAWYANGGVVTEPAVYRSGQWMVQTGRGQMSGVRLE